ncbi:MAG TPA: hypothetical protein DD381_02135 [Lentisphaeria bacterium]|nr:MAG: hypothetical protein A2X47_08900 [Lentisphaerae bacterium GWF2_38_69]HBM15135.1 hypothetical protein [Lentisphaeria bacterium]
MDKYTQQFLEYLNRHINSKLYEKFKTLLNNAYDDEGIFNLPFSNNDFQISEVQEIYKHAREYFPFIPQIYSEMDIAKNTDEVLSVGKSIYYSPGKISYYLCSLVQTILESTYLSNTISNSNELTFSHWLDSFKCRIEKEFNNKPNLADPLSALCDICAEHLSNDNQYDLLETVFNLGYQTACNQLEQRGFDKRILGSSRIREGQLNYRNDMQIPKNQNNRDYSEFLKLQKENPDLAKNQIYIKIAKKYYNQDYISDPSRVTDKIKSAIYRKVKPSR